MARKDALLRLHESLIAKRDALREKFAEQDEQPKKGSDRKSEIGDAAHDGEQNELDSQLAAMESRELRQIERALQLIRTGQYGLCESCEQQIPIARLKALPYTPLCVECQRTLEASGESWEDRDVDWKQAADYEGRMNDSEVSLRDLEYD